MMIYAIRDNVAGRIAGGLMLFASDAEAKRAFEDVLGAAESPAARHPEDYDLYRCGDLNEDDVCIVDAVSAVLVAHGSAVARREADLAQQVARLTEIVEHLRKEDR